MVFFLITNTAIQKTLKIAKPNSKEKTLLIAFPSNGLVGTFSISYLIYNLKMKHIGELDIQDMPLTLFVEGGEILSPIRIYNKDNIYIIISDVPLNDILAKDFALAVCEFCKKNTIKKVLMISGMETINQQKDIPKIYGLATQTKLENILYVNGIPKFLDGSIFGTDAIIISIFRKKKIPLLLLYAECHPYFPDPEASSVAIKMLAKLLNIKINEKEIQDRMEKLRIQHRNLMEETVKAIQRQKGKPPQIYR